MTSDGSAHYPGDDYVIPFGQAKRVREGDRITVVSWGAMVLRCIEAVDRLGAGAGVDLSTCGLSRRGTAPPYWNP